MRVIFPLLVVLVLGPIAYVFGPAGLGGLSTYAVTAGTSMAPNFATGDLVILRKGDPLRVGDIGGYRSGLTGQIVVHRVIAEDHGRLTFQGDNNWWIDTYQPTQDEVVGKLWVHIGGAGKKVNAVQPAWMLGGLGGILGMTFMGTGSGPPDRKRRTKQRWSNPFAAQAMQGLLLGLVMVTVIAGAITFLAFRADTTQAAERIVTAQHTGVFSYEGPAPVSPVYDQGEILTGDPILTDLLETVSSSFVYKLDAPGAAELHGTIAMFATIRDVNGWERTIPILPSAEFDGTATSLGGVVPVADITTFITSIQASMGDGIRYWTIAVTGDVHISGVIEGQPFQSEFHPSYTLRVVPPNQLYLETAATRDFESVPPLTSPALGSVFLPVKEFTISVPERIPASMSLVVIDIGVSRLRIIAGSLAAAGLLATVVVAVLYAMAMRSPAARFSARYGNKLVRVSTMNTDPASTVTLPTMRDLIRVAENNHSVILWKRDGDDDTYLVQEDKATFMYRPASATSS